MVKRIENSRAWMVSATGEFLTGLPSWVLTMTGWAKATMGTDREEMKGFHINLPADPEYKRAWNRHTDQTHRFQLELQIDLR